MDSGTELNLNGVWGAASDSVYAVGDGATLLHFDGAEWAAVTTGLESSYPAGVNFTAVWGRDGRVYVAGTQGWIMRYTGSAWVQMSFPVFDDTTGNPTGPYTSEYRSIWAAPQSSTASNATLVYVFGVNRGFTYDPASDAIAGLVYRDGSTFSFSAMANFHGASGYADAGNVIRPINVSSVPFEGIYVDRKRLAAGDQVWPLLSAWAVSIDDIYVLGGHARRNTSGDPDIAVIGPTGWRSINPLLDWAWGVWADESGSNVFAVGENQVGNGMGISYYDGNVDDTWTIQHQTIDGRILNSVFGFTAEDVFAVGSGGTILRYTEEQEVRHTAANYSYSGAATPFVDAYTGELLVKQVDVDLAGPLPLVLHRYYASGLQADVGIGSDMGNNWSHNFNWRLIKETLAGVETAVVITNVGRRIEFENKPGGWEQTDDMDAVFRLVPDGSTLRLVDVKAEQTLIFGSNGSRLLALTDRHQNRLTLFYNASTAMLERISDGKGRILNLASEDGRIVEVSYQGLDFDGVTTFAAQRTILFSYDDEGNLSTATDQAGGVTRYSYDQTRLSDALLVAVQRPEQNTPLAWSYDDEDRVASQTRADGGSNTFSYQSGTSPTAVSFPGGGSRRFRHNQEGQLVSIVDELDKEVTFDYDESGRRVSSTTRDGALVSVTWHEDSGKIASETNPGTGTVEYTYEEQLGPDGQAYYDLVTTVWPDGTSDQYSYDEDGNQRTWTDAENRLYGYEYDDAGNLTGMTNPQNGTWQLTYDVPGNLTTALSSQGHLTRWEYDGFGNTIRTIYPNDDNATVTRVFDSRGHLVRTIDEENNTTEMDLDGNARVTRLSGPEGFVTTFSYDPMDRLTGVRDGEPGDPQAKTVQLEYDQRSNINGIVDQHGQRDTLQYDLAGRPTHYRPNDVAANAVAMNYSDEGIVTSIDRPSGRSYSSLLAPDGSGRRDSLADADTTLVFGYNTRGQEEEIKDGGGQVLVRRTHASDGEITGVALPRAGVSSGFDRVAYGTVGDVTDPQGIKWQYLRNDMGQMAEAVDPLGMTTKYAYDSRGWLQRVEHPAGIGSVDQEYDGRGNVTRQTFSDGTNLGFAYDGWSQLVSATGVTLERDDKGNIINSNGIVNGYDASGRLETVTYSDGLVVRYMYRADGLIEAIKDSLGGTESTVVEFDYDVDGNATEIRRANSRDTGFGYSPAGRRNSIDHGAIGSVSMAINSLGEIDAVDRTPSYGVSTLSDTVYSYDNANQRTDGTHDSRGQIVADGQRNYQWDLAGRLTSLQTQAGARSYTYDALGMRLSDTARNYVWNYAQGAVAVAEIDTAGSVARYVYLPNGRLHYRVVNGQREFYHFDEAGNTMALSDGAGDVVVRYGYSPYGETLAAEPSNVDNPFTWLGKWNGIGDDSGLYYLRTRYYDPGRGRFVSRDSIASAYPRSTNPYQYAMGNPVRYSDPTGLWFWSNDEATAEELETQVEGGLLKLLERGLSAAVGTVKTVLDKRIGEPAARAMSSLAELSTAHFNSYRGPVESLAQAVRNQMPVNMLKYIDGQMSREAATQLGVSRAKGLLNVAGSAVTFYAEDSAAYTTTTTTKYTGKALATGTDALISVASAPAAAAAVVSDALDWASESLFGPNMKIALVEPVRNAGRAVTAIVDDGYAYATGDRRAGQATAALTRQIQTKQGLTGRFADTVSPIVEALSPAAWGIKLSAAWDTYQTDQKLIEMRVKRAQLLIDDARAQAARAGQ